MAIKLKESISVEPDQLELLDKFFDKIEVLKPGKYKVYILDEKPNRSLSQNAYYWGVVLKVLQDFSGVATEELHDLFRKKFLPRLISFSGEADEIVGGSTKKLDTAAFIEYIEKIRMWALDFHNWYIPLPQQVAGDDFSDMYIEAIDLNVK